MGIWPWIFVESNIFLVTVNGKIATVMNGEIAVQDRGLGGPTEFCSDPRWQRAVAENVPTVVDLQQ